MRNPFAERNGNRFNDKAECTKFAKMFNSNDKLLCEYLLGTHRYTGDTKLILHPFGKYAIDAIICKRDANPTNYNRDGILMYIDFEKHKDMYKDITLLNRKKKYLRRGIPFILFIFNATWTEWMVVDNKIIMLTAPETGYIERYSYVTNAKYNASGLRIPHSEFFRSIDYN